MTTPLVVLSHSDISQFLTCRRQFLWGYLQDRNPPDSKIGALALGSRVHVALELSYKTGEDAVSVHDRLVAADIAEMEAAGAPGYDLDKLYEDAIVGRNCVVAYMEWLEAEGADHGLSVHGVESQIQCVILDGRVLLRGKVDLRLLRDSDGRLIIVDFKTTGRAVSMLALELERSYQPRVYDIIQRLADPTLEVAEARFRILKKVTRKQHGTPGVTEISVPGLLRSRPTYMAQIEAICSEILRLVDAAAEGHSDALFYPSPGEHCGWCAFKHPCTIAQENPATAVEMLDELFIRGRHDRYDTD